MQIDVSLLPNLYKTEKPTELKTNEDKWIGWFNNTLINNTIRCKEQASIVSGRKT